MPLSTDETRTTAAEFTRDVFQQRGDPASIGTQAIRAAIAYTITWVEANIADYLAGLPEPFKASSTALQKQLLFMWSVRKLFK